MTTEQANKPNAKHIILAENDRGLQIILRLMLKEAGFKVTVCKSSDETYKKIMETIKKKAVIDLLVMDLQTQELGGDELLNRIAATSFHFPIIKLTNSMDDDNDLSTENNILTLSKPFSPQTLMGEIHRIFK